MHIRHFIIITILTLGSVLSSCGGRKSSNDDSSENTHFSRALSPMDLYFMCPTAMLVSPGGGDNRTAYLPDFINYPNDLTKLGLRGHVKECVAGVSTIKFTYRFNMSGNMTNYQFRMDSQGFFGEGARMEYDALGHLTLLGRDFNRQSTNSHTYIYENDVLVRRESGRRFRVYEWINDKEGNLIPTKVTNNGLKPAMEMKYGYNSDGNVVLTEMSYDNPNLPGSLTAKKGVSNFEYFNDGRLKKVCTAYKGCSDRTYNEMWGVCEYAYNSQGDVEKMVRTLYDNNTDNKQQIYTVTQTYSYKYDTHNNWTYVNMESSDPQVNNLSSFSRTFEYYTDEEIQAIENEKKEITENPFIGRWVYEEKEDLGDGEWLNTNCGMVMNLYEKTFQDIDDKPMYGVISSGYNSNNGIYKMTPWGIVSANVKGNTADIEVCSGNTGDVYSVKLTYNPKNMTISVGAVKFKEEELSDDEDIVINVSDILPPEGVYKFAERSTSY